MRNHICRNHITLQIKTQKTTCIQLLHNYLLGITTNVQLSFFKYNLLINKLLCQKNQLVIL
jgi:hypothetical protein